MTLTIDMVEVVHRVFNDTIALFAIETLLTLVNFILFDVFLHDCYVQLGTITNNGQLFSMFMTAHALLVNDKARAFDLAYFID